jgi:mono/diheme cytochrome c family protein
MSSVMECSSHRLVCKFVISLTVVFVGHLCGASAQANPIFDSKCAGCHTVGGGASVGPDLAGTKDWDSEKLVPAIRAMEKNCGPLTDSDINDLVSYLKGKNISNSSVSADAPKILISPTPTPTSTPATELETGSVADGERIFNGSQPLSKGGLACIACHQVEGSGGTMGPDLTTIGRKMSPAVLKSACLKTPFKVMSSAYRDHPLSEQEALDLSSYLGTAKDSNRKAKEPPTTLGALAVSGLVLFGIALGYRNRQSVRSKLRRRRS